MLPAGMIDEYEVLGRRYYKHEDGREFLADVYDNYTGHNRPKMKVITNKKFKGHNACKKRAFLNDLKSY